jgi:hypothetical protein
VAFLLADSDNNIGARGYADTYSPRPKPPKHIYASQVNIYYGQ